MKIKDGVILAGLDIKMRPALVEADEIWMSYGKHLTVTSGLDGEHSAGSLHYYGLALDFRTRYFSESEGRLICAKLQEALSLHSPNFQVILHSSHMHVEYDDL